MVFSSSLRAQASSSEEIARLTVSEMRFIKDLKVKGDFIYCVGFRYFDENKRLSVLNKYDLKLNLIWSKVIHDAETNRFDYLFIDEDRIFVSGCIGKIEMSGIEAQRYLYEFSDDGEMRRRTLIGPAAIPSTPIRKFKTKLWFAHRAYSPKPGSSSISEISMFTELVSYDIETQKLERYQGALQNVNPSNLIVEASKVLVYGSFYQTASASISQVYILSLEGTKLKEKLVEREQSEWLLSTVFYPADQEAHLISFKAGGPDSLRYLRMEAYDFESNLLSSKRLFANDLGAEIKHINYYAFNEDNHIWLLLREGSHYNYLRYNRQAEELERLKLPYLRSNPRPFFISSELQIQAISDENALGQNVILITGQSRD